MKVVILGGGLTGLTSAYHLQKNVVDYIILEKERNVGGLCRSVSVNDFTFDYTGHFLHFDKSQYNAKRFVFNLLKDDIIKVTRNAKIYTKFAITKDKLIPYPFQANIKFLLPHIRKECINGLIWANILNNKNKYKNFLTWLHLNFGSGITKYFFEPYNKKIWKGNLEQISATWVKKFVPQVDLETVLNSIIYDKTTEGKYGYNFQFYYPKSGGIQRLIDNLYSRLYNDKILTSAEVVNVNTKQKKVSFLHRGKVESLKYDFLISTIPLPELLKIVDISKIKIYADKLKYVSVVCFNIAVKKTIMKGVHWVYFPDEEITFYRVGFYHNINKNLSPAGYGSMYVEVSTKDLSQTKINLLRKKVSEQLVKVGVINSEKDILFTNILYLPYAYVIYDHYRDKILPLIFNKLKQYKIYSIGRYGAWKYSYMAENIDDAIETVELLCSKIK